MVHRAGVHQFIAFRAKRLGGVDTVAHVDDLRLTVQIDDETADVVVVVAFAVVAALDGGIQPAAPPRKHLQIRQRGEGRALRLLRLRAGREQPLQNAAHLRGIDRANGGSPPRQPKAEALQLRLMRPSAEQRDPLAVELRLRVAIRKVDEIIPRDVDVHRERGDAPNQRFVVKAHAPAGRLIHAFQRVKQRRARHVEIARALVASPIRRQNRQIAVQHPHRAGHALAPAPDIPLQKQQRVDHVRENPRRPVADVLADHAHPPEIVAVHKRGNDAPVDLVSHAPRDQRADPVELILQQIQDIRQRRRRLRRKEIDIRVIRVRQRPLVHRRAAGVVAAVVRAEHPCRLLADAPQPVDHRVQIRSVVQQTFAQRRAHQPVSPRKIRLFIGHSVARSAKREELRRRHHRVALPGLIRPA